MKLSCNLILAGWYLYNCDIILDFVLASVFLVSHILNCYLFYKSSYLKQKLKNLLVNTEKAINVFSLVSCSIKFHLLFTWKSFMFYSFTWKIFLFLHQEMVVGVGKLYFDIILKP